VAWLERHFDCRPRKDGAEICICNPFTPDTSYKFNINPERGACHCWTGDESAGPANPKTGQRNCALINFVKVHKKCTYAEAVRDILGASVSDLKAYLRPENRASTADLRKIVVSLPEGTERLADNQGDKQASIIISWLKSRGYTLDEIDRADLHFLGLTCYWP